VLFLEKLALLQPGRRLLIKNPVYSARIAMLREIWPEAKFIHVYRNPYRVFASTRTFYARLLQEFALQRFEHAGIDELILYPRMMGRLLEDAAALPEAAYAEIRFESFVRRPLGEPNWIGFMTPSVSTGSTPRNPASRRISTRFAITAPPGTPSPGKPNCWYGSAGHRSSNGWIMLRPSATANEVLCPGLFRPPAAATRTGKGRPAGLSPA
jgi:Sulfotransferase family